MTAPSLRRWYLDECYARTFNTTFSGLMLDVGGQRINRRGAFNLEAHARRVVIVNLRHETRPDVVADAERLPIRGRSVDGVLCSEVLEHVPYPARLVSEFHRVLRPRGLAVMSAPFLVPFHADPGDHWRLLPDQWHVLCRAQGFAVRWVEAQGSVASVLVDGLAHVGWTLLQDSPWVGRDLIAVARSLMRLARWVDARWPVAGVTTGWVCVAQKP